MSYLLSLIVLKANMQCVKYAMCKTLNNCNSVFFCARIENKKLKMLLLSNTNFKNNIEVFFLVKAS